MTDYRTRAAEVKAAGEEARGDFTPTGVPLRMYNWWLANSPGKKAEAINDGDRRENFCHFWRVVVLWTPLLALGITFVSFFEWFADRVPGAVIATVLLVATVIVGSTVLTTTGHWIDFLQIVGIAAAGLAGITAILVGGEWLSRKFDWFVPAILFTLLGVVIVGVLYFAVSAWGFIFFAYAAASLIGAGILGFAIFKIGERIQAKRAYALKQAQIAREARDAELERLWLLFVRGEGPDPYARKAKVKKTPSAFELKVKAFFSGLGDFLVLATQVVRVNKWKICPLVDVVPQNRTPADF